MKRIMSKEEFLSVYERQQASGLTIKDFCENEAYSWRTRQTLWSAVQMLTQKLCCQTIHDCPKVVPLHYESE